MTALTTAQAVLLHNTQAVTAALEAQDRQLAEVQPIDWSAANDWAITPVGPSLTFQANVLPMWLASAFDGTVRGYTVVGPVDDFAPFSHIIRWLGVEVYALARFVEPEAPAGLSARTVDDDAAPESFETASRLIALLPERVAVCLSTRVWNRWAEDGTRTGPEVLTISFDNPEPGYFDREFPSDADEATIRAGLAALVAEACDALDEEEEGRLAVAALTPRPALYGIVEIKGPEILGVHQVGTLATPDLEADEVFGHLGTLSLGMTARGWDFEGVEDTGLEAPRDVRFLFSRPAAPSCSQPCCRGLRAETRFEVEAQ